MLSNREKTFLNNPSLFSRDYAYRLKSTIKQKLSITVTDLNLIIANAETHGIDISPLMQLKPIPAQSDTTKIESSSLVSTAHDDDGW